MNCTLNLISLSCFQSSEAEGDEIYLVFRGEKIWPPTRKFKELKSNEGLQISFEMSNIQMDKLIAVELWEHDLFFDDHLGSFEFLIDTIVNDFVSHLKRIKSDAVY